MTLKIRRINHFTLKALSGEQDKARRFYTKVLGLTEVPIPDALSGHYELLWFKLEDILLHIEFVKNYVIHPIEYENEAVITPHHVALEVEDIDNVRLGFEQHKAPIIEAVTIPDRSRFYVLDPFGNFFEIIEFHKDKKSRKT